MTIQRLNKLEWRQALGAIAISIGAFSAMESPAQATPEPVQDSFELAQVGVRSRINAPTPLNLSPRSHTPLPTNSRSSDYYYGSSGYRDSYQGSYRHDRCGYDCDRYHHEHHHTHHRRSRRNGPVIIINPASSSTYTNYNSQSSYIRVIRK